MSDTPAPVAQPPYTDDDIAYWRRQMTSRNVAPDLPWADADVMAIVARFIGHIDAARSVPDNAALRERLTYFDDDEIVSSDDGRFEMTVGELRALAAAPASPAGLDVERLALALRTVTRGTWSTPARRTSEAQRKQDEQWLLETAEKVAREYAALASPEEASPDD